MAEGSDRIIKFGLPNTRYEHTIGGVTQCIEVLFTVNAYTDTWGLPIPSGSNRRLLRIELEAMEGEKFAKNTFAIKTDEQEEIVSKNIIM